MTNEELKEAREGLRYNKKIEQTVGVILERAQVDVENIRELKYDVSDELERAVRLCDYFRTTKYYKAEMTDEEIIERHNKLEKEFEEESNCDTQHADSMNSYKK